MARGISFKAMMVDNESQKQFKSGDNVLVTLVDGSILFGEIIRIEFEECLVLECDCINGLVEIGMHDIKCVGEGKVK